MLDCGGGGEEDKEFLEDGLAVEKLVQRIGVTLYTLHKLLRVGLRALVFGNSFGGSYCLRDSPDRSKREKEDECGVQCGPFHSKAQGKGKG